MLVICAVIGGLVLALFALATVLVWLWTARFDAIWAARKRARFALAAGALLAAPSWLTLAVSWRTRPREALAAASAALGMSAPLAWSDDGRVLLCPPA